MPNYKNSRLAEDIKRELSGLIRERIKDPRVNASFVSVIRTELAADNSHCKVYISSIDGLESAGIAVEGLKSASGLLAREIANKLHMRKCPDFRFFADDSVDYYNKINRILDSEKNNAETD